MTRDEEFMQRALDLARQGEGNVRPNPMVGCVIVYLDRIIGEGYHMAYGGPHAEPNAIGAVRDQELLNEATVYVNLEPCAHWGKTPPCADLLVKTKVKKVVIACVDSNPLVGGKGISKLLNAGIEVETGVLEREAKELNRRFFTYIEKKRPYVLLKWAETLDGFVARENFDSKWISNTYSRQLVHKWRSEEAAIMVGTSTAQYDNPKLNVRDWSGNDPIRVVIDRHLTLDPNLYLFDHSQSTICYNQLKQESEENLEFVQMPADFEIEEVLQDLYNKKVQSILVEGGSQILNKFISKNLWDEARVFTGPVSFGKGIKAPNIQGLPYQESGIMGDKLKIYRNTNQE
ncbi:Diaminohydroxyphosphoribosylaminopyrimidine deaminase [Indibacter alkaliphilus LW1]|uniref:Riboflavin biosynthesis protein RibD n=1 Tax=Indibacter alkaliphilus (strain CCUG 57479 / KCTC 22604 / LW1) TaxID=1189612 RepID=S2DHH1_INDAL|nr:bifunctional diaminohydroxyphosphoribosylaminopyrimidine deaminase/5-amino-6-(5-phosphoribosylamino)uracil reductase RibD [Indibacter alkaliphilus]EOZ96550.1 Diaminohydroxyphosphoribosylaminopyrimidine deaminase [Indibacter alkaliphilus LW1]